ncbi:flavoprotein [Nocardiopsis sp. ATB16-24]|uniref:flavoprotein n=1 Tax=Nocardiopsis sp. ATB16-24 TaxID=3019555 RepID=UPI00255607CE|nr:flavoprotein [Nocardiopsis sp. ATB16-24]
MPEAIIDQKTLYAVVCAAKSALEVGKMVDLTQDRGWPVQVVAAQATVSFIDIEALEKQVRRLVRSEHRKPDKPRSPRSDAIIITPVTFNAINKMLMGSPTNSF